MTRIFLPLAGLSTAFLLIAMFLGFSIDDPMTRTMDAQATVQYHFLFALAALVFATFVHAIVLTYFMGTSRWIEETSSAYRLNPELYQQNKRVKYRTIPLMVFCFVLLLFTAGWGAASDPASPMRSAGWFGVPAHSIHLVTALVTIGMNLAVNWLEFLALERNGEIVNQVLAEVRRIRLERGLAVDS